MKVPSITFLVLLSFSVMAGMPGKTPLASEVLFQQSILATDAMEIFEGLPHQMFERDLLKQEEKRSDVKRIAGYPFYTPALHPKDGEILKKIVSDPSTLKSFAGEKLCGGFHPDFCLSWTLDAKTFNALICFGCHEMILETGGESFRYDLREKAHGELRKALTPYAVKRPQTNRG